LTVNLDAGGSTDPDAGDTLSYSWDLNNDNIFGDATTATTSVNFTTSGNKTVRVQVTDNHGASAIATTTISVAQPNLNAPDVFIDSPLSSALWKVGDVISFSGHASDVEDGALPPSAIGWQMILHQGAA